MFNFLVFEPMHESGMQVLRDAGNVRMASDPKDEDAIIAEVQDIDAIAARAMGGVTRRIVENAPRLKIVGRHGVGVDNIDIEACTEHGVQVVNTPLATVESVAEHTLGLMLDASKRMAFGDAQLRQGNWAVRYDIMGREMRGRVLGIIGFGRIGRRLAEICHKGLGMQILYSDVVAAPELEQELGARKVGMDELLQTAEYVTVHVPLVPATRGLIGEREFGLMQPHALFFNCSRGPVIDEMALYRAMRDGVIAGAGIDVFEQEPTPEDNPLFELENMIVTPHMASTTQEAMVAMSLVAEDLVRYLKGEPVLYPVNKLS